MGLMTIDGVLDIIEPTHSKRLLTVAVLNVKVL